MPAQSVSIRWMQNGTESGVGHISLALRLAAWGSRGGYPISSNPANDSRVNQSSTYTGPLPYQSRKSTGRPALHFTCSSLELQVGHPIRPNLASLLDL